MGIKNKNGLLVSYPCEELIQDISEDIFLFGEDYRKNLKSIENERVVLMTAKELLEKLLLQNSII